MDGDAPHPRRHFAPALVAIGRSPDGHEGVLYDLLGHLAIGATAGDPGHDPRLVTLVEHAQGTSVLPGDGGQELGIGALRAAWIHTRLCHRTARSVQDHGGPARPVTPGRRRRSCWAPGPVGARPPKPPSVRR